MSIEFPEDELTHFLGTSFVLELSLRESTESASEGALPEVTLSTSGSTGSWLNTIYSRTGSNQRTTFV